MADQRSVVNRELVETDLSSNFLLSENLGAVYRRRPRRPPFLLVESDGIGVTSSDQGNEERNKKKTREVKHCKLVSLLHCNANFNCLQAQFTLGQSSCNPVLKGSQNCGSVFPFLQFLLLEANTQHFTAYFSYSGRQNLTARIS